VINFRYHVVSLAAVFFALAIGLVVGTSAFNGPLVEQLGDEVDSMKRANDGYREEIDQLKDEATQDQRFATESIPHLIGDKLRDRRVLVITTSDADKEYIEGMIQQFDVVGLKVTGRISLLKKFVDPASNEELLDLADTVTPDSVTGLPTNTVGAETSAALLAAVLVDRPAPAPAVSTEQRREVLSAYKDAGYLIPSPDVTGPAEVVLVLAGAPYAEKDASRLNGALRVAVAEFDKPGPIVVAGSSTGGDGNLVAQVRGDSTLSKQVSTIDNVATPQGRAATLLALLYQLSGKVGHYGVGNGATALLPPIAERNGS
jgi:hypothetical protein